MAVITGSEFVRRFANKGAAAWEAAALRFAQDGGLVPWPTFDLPLTDDQGNTATLTIETDVAAIGTLDDHVRMPLTPSRAQDVCNLSGALLPTPWIVYQIWRAAPIKIRPIEFPNVGVSLKMYADHDALIDESLSQLDRKPEQAAAGLKKHLVMSNEFRPGHVLIFGWYRPLAPDVFDDHQPMRTPGRQPIQPLSNLHGGDYVDYSHGIQIVRPTAIVNGKPMGTAELYRHPTLSRLVSNEGPLRFLRYPSEVSPATNLPPPIQAADQTATREAAPTPSISDLGYGMITRGATPR